jgi:serine/threonine-protein kinase SRPK3
VASPHGEHVVLALQVSQMSIRDMDTVFMNGRGFNEDFVKGAVMELLEALDICIARYNQYILVGNYLPFSSIHAHIGTNILTRAACFGNRMFIRAICCSGRTNDDAIFQKLEDNEFSSPVPRKQLETRTIYLSHDEAQSRAATAI